MLFLYKYWHSLDFVFSTSQFNDPQTLASLNCELELTSSLNNAASVGRLSCIPQLKLHAASFGHYYLD